ncbi:ABC transporter permease [Paenibacillus lignilyticus]|uniref:ABC-2 family transporter protein n=1 Tax=Paenibacillus lignilyticus TaxID=1172615 RepID=A0ABS5CI33_9BACL|nr:ABC-2 family transporter protein [Paenibacillus lignilyticus]MBP3965471.1 ABC-2 family transporter protein [Paenibacillus lignilyticus]
MSAYYYFFKMRILTTIAYRFEVFTGMASNAVMLLASVFLWKAAYRGIGSVQDVSQDQMIVYAILAVVMGAVLAVNVQNDMYYRVREGQIATDFIKPIHLLGMFLAEDLGTTVSALVNQAIPLILLASILFTPPTPVSLVAFLLFIPSLMLSFLLLWLMGAIIGMISFWVMELGNLGIVKDAIVRILSGSLIPIWFFPGWMATTSSYLPFQYMYQTPLSIYIGKISYAQAGTALVIQAVWIAVLAFIAYVVWQRAQRVTLIQGG